MKQITRKNKIYGTFLMCIAVAVISIAVSKAPDLYPKAVVETPDTTVEVSTTEAVLMGEENEPQTVVTTAPPETTHASQPIGEYSRNGYIVVTEDAAMEMYSIASDRLISYAETINQLSDKVPGVAVYSMLAPTRMEFYGPEEYRTGSHSQARGIQIAYEHLSPFVQSVDVVSAIAPHTDEYVYFRTDHHWTARGAYYAYRAFCDTLHLPCAPLESYESGKLDNFVGSMYRTTQSENLKNNPDYVEYFLPKGETSGEYYSTPAMDDGKKLHIISTKITDPSSKYLAFIQGDQPLIKMTSDCGSGNKILLIKESFGNALAPFLLENYSEVYVLDPRQAGVQGMNLPQFIKDHEIGEVLFCNYTMVPSNSKYMNALQAMINA